MARKTIASLEADIEGVKAQRDMLAEDVLKLKRSRDSANTTIQEKDAEIFKLRRHVGFVHAQRDRLVGFIEGQRSITEPNAVRIEDNFIPQATTVSRVEKFIDECTLRFEGMPDDIVSNDPFRSGRRRY